MTQTLLFYHVPIQRY